ncbi:protein kinase domain-containing protein [Colletotrichum karsti]|uniref:Protein kinase domain-containing protein n=1 Tax=Colletotrichum karsti TaxID=1095194 RepID=A0A9P6LRA7_9PEZI|nr:protein kinase domain-containing protein [Colletotrichum karsti]KAF9882272.1 protein kinase domain-containing protein [Colletotrichum karsti]
MKDGVSDLDLPLVENEDPDLHDPGDNSLYRANEKRERQGKPLNCCEHWGPERRKQFSYNHVNHYTLKDHHLLPFIKYGSGLSDGANIHKVHGGFSQVFFVHIHPEHHEFDDDDLDAERGFAVKQLTDEGHHANEKFKKEVNMLKKFTGDGAHSHVVSVLATYEQFGRFHLIFHRANGDLFNYWKRICPSPKFDYATVVWVAKQLAGLADGLYRFHRHYTTPKTSEADQSSEDTNEKDHKNRPKDIFEENILTGTKCTRFQGDQLPHTTNKAARPTQEDLITQYGRHGDLKPENLLWFPHRGDEKGILKIIDFGQAELHSENSKTYRQSRGIDTLTYRPPEGEIQPLMMRQSSDIWSLGCIYLEFVTWMFDGAEGVQSFKTSRLSYDPHLRMKSDKFFECVTVSGFEHDGAQLKHSVSKHIEDLASRADCSEYFKDVLGLIRDMLVIEPSEDHPPPNRRKCCGEVRNFLEKAYEKCLKTRSYAMGG